MRKIIDERILLVGLLGSLMDGAAILGAYKLGLPNWLCLVIGFIPSTIGNKLITWVVNAICKISMEFASIVIILIFVVISVLLWKTGNVNVWANVPYYLIPGIILSFISVFIVQYKQAKSRDRVISSFEKSDGKLVIDEDAINKEMESHIGQNKEIQGEYDKENSAVCENGVFVGEIINDVRVFKGIPYAIPPVGRMRWKAPKRVQPSTKVYEAYYYGNSAPQPYSNYTVASFNTMDEDCLTLNIWKSKEAPEKCPVIVCLNTFDWCVGGTAAPICDGDCFVKENPEIIFVNINFRLGLLGNMDFSDIPGGDEYKDSRNLGLQDQVEALKWIHRNIKAFGGDPDNVTIVGDYGGGVAVTLLSIMSEVKGLFKRAISIGGTVNMTSDLHSFKELQREVKEYFGVKTIEEHLKLSSDELARAVYKNHGLNDAMPVRDGQRVPVNIKDSFLSGNASDIDMMIIVSKEESRFVNTIVGDNESFRSISEQYFKKMFETITEPQKQCLKEYMEDYYGTYEKGKIYIHELMTELVGHYPMFSLCKAHAESGGNCRYMVWDIKSPVKEIGANSMITTVALLGKEEYYEACGIASDPLELKAVRKAFVNFAKSGDPSIKYGEIDNVYALDWPPFSSDNVIMVADDNGIMPDEGHLSQKMRKLEPLDNILFNVH